jgi:predicted MFS family arabinose efflux permease
MLVKFGAAWCFGLNATSFLVVIAALLAVQIPAMAPGVPMSIMASVRQGLRFIQSRAGLLPLIVLSFTMTIFGMSFIVFLPAFAKDVLAGGEREFTTLMSISGAGSILGALFVAATARGGRELRLMLGGLLLLGSALVAFAYSPSFTWAAVTIFIASGALMAVFALVTSLVQLRTPNDMRGRVMGVYNIAFRGGMPIGSLVMGEVIGHMGVSPVLAMAGMALVVLALVYISTHRLFRLGEREAAS